MINKKERLRELIDQQCLKVGADFALSTGQSSGFYFDTKWITLNGEGLALIADFMLDEIGKLPTTPTAIGGLTMGADFIVAGVILRASQMGLQTTQGSIVRKQPKQHGTRSRIEHQLPPGTAIVVIDDVITTGTSTLIACDEFESAGYAIVGVLTIVDREAGGLERLRNRYGHAEALFRTRDFPRALAHLEGPAPSQKVLA